MIYVFDHRRETAQQIAVLCNCFIEKKATVEWILPLPLYHFLNGSCKPFDKSEMYPDKINWELEGFDIWKIRKKLLSSNKRYDFETSYL